jgi:hypothetical protein
MKDYAYPMLVANQKIKLAHDQALKKDYLSAADSLADAIIWLRQAKEAFLEHEEVERIWAEHDQK